MPFAIFARAFHVDVNPFTISAKALDKQTMPFTVFVNAFCLETKPFAISAEIMASKKMPSAILANAFDLALELPPVTEKAINTGFLFLLVVAIPDL